MFGLALAQARSGHHEDALAEYDGILKEWPDDVEALLARADVQTWMRRYDAARRDCERVLAVDPKRSEARLKIERLDTLTGKNRKAIRSLHEYLRQHPGDREARYLLAQAYEWIGQHRLASELLLPLVGENPSDKSATALLQDVQLHQAAATEIEQRWSTQSNHLTIQSEAIRQAFALNGGETTFVVAFEYQSYSSSVERPGNVQVYREAP